MWHCVCECGKETNVNSYALKTGHTQSCGCYKKDRIIETSKKHGGYGTLLYKTYYNMKNRCYNPNYYLFRRYGGRGISIVNEWLGENGFENFRKWSLENGYREGLSIDRIDVDGNYSPDNCRWVTMKQQQNNRSNNVILNVDGVSHTLKEWSEIAGVHYSTIQHRISKGKDVKEAIFGKRCGG